jgi:hypothetical protein
MKIIKYKGYDIQIITLPVEPIKTIFKADLRCKGFTPFHVKSILGAKQMITRHINYLKHKEVLDNLHKEIGLI